MFRTKTTTERPARRRRGSKQRVQQYITRGGLPTVEPALGTRIIISIGGIKILMIEINNCRNGTRCREHEKR